MTKAVAGTVTLDGAPLAGVEVVLTDGAGKPLAFVAAGVDGGFAFDAAAGFSGWAVARLHEPFVGAAAVAVRAGAPATIAIASKDAATLSLTVKAPAGVAFDWAQVGLTPRAVAGVPDPVIAAAWLVGIGPSVRGAYHDVRITDATLRVRVLPATWGINVGHVVERSPSPRPAPPSWVGDVLVLRDGTRVPAAVGEHRLTITGDVDGTIESRIFDDGVPHGR